LWDPTGGTLGGLPPVRNRRLGTPVGAPKLEDQGLGTTGLRNTVWYPRRRTPVGDPGWSIPVEAHNGETPLVYPRWVTPVVHPVGGTPSGDHLWGTLVRGPPVEDIRLGTPRGGNPGGTPCGGNRNGGPRWGFLVGCTRWGHRLGTPVVDPRWGTTGGGVAVRYRRWGNPGGGPHFGDARWGSPGGGPPVGDWCSNPVGNTR
jgi:hypothetical protein